MSMSSAAKLPKRYRQTEIGLEARCSKCRDYWPADSEFFYVSPDGRLHSWCKACYVQDRVEKGRRPNHGKGITHHDHARAGR
jgi:hypothetical protein